MISYFKYDKGNAFTLNDEPYYGYFHVLSGVAYSEKTTVANSKQLTPNSNFLSELYLNNAAFDGVKPSLDYAIANSFDILNQQTINDLLDRINQNNLKIYQTGIYINGDLIPFDDNATFFYTLTSTEADIRADDEMYPRRVYTHSDPFAFSEEWAFLDDAEYGALVPKGETGFIYYCVCDSVLYAFEGDFVNPSGVLKSANTPYQNTIKIDINLENNELFLYSNEELSIIDLQKYEDCNVAFPSDSIAISTNKQSVKFFKIGFDKRTEYVNGEIYIKLKYSNEIYKKLSLADLNLDTLLALDIRKQDDNVLILGKKGNKTYFIFFDIYNFDATYRYEEILDVENINDVYFSSQDSDFFYMKIKNPNFTKNKASFDIRSLQHINIKVTPQNDLRFLYLSDYLFNNTVEKIDEIQIKFNSNSLPSNSYNNLVFDFYQKGEYLYYVLHNIGRIYFAKTTNNFNNYLIPLNVDKKYKNFNCNNSSLGLSFNSAILNLLRDLLNVATLLEKVKAYDGNTIKPIEFATPVSEIEFELTNLFINGNESINVVSIQRIFALINDIQKKLIN